MDLPDRKTKQHVCVCECSNDFSVRKWIFQLGKLPGWVVVCLGVTHIQRSSSVAKMAGDGFVTDVGEDLGHFWGEGRCTA